MYSSNEFRVYSFENESVSFETMSQNRINRNTKNADHEFSDIVYAQKRNSVGNLDIEELSREVANIADDSTRVNFSPSMLPMINDKEDKVYSPSSPQRSHRPKMKRNISMSKKAWESHFDTFLSKLSTTNPSTDTNESSNIQTSRNRKKVENIKLGNRNENYPLNRKQKSNCLDVSLRDGVRVEGKYQNTCHAVFSNQRKLKITDGKRIEMSNNIISFFRKKISRNFKSSEMFDVSKHNGALRNSSQSSKSSCCSKSSHKEMRKCFTEFHSSNKYGKDSASAFLGEESSVHNNSIFRNDARNIKTNDIREGSLYPKVDKFFLPSEEEIGDCSEGEVLYPLKSIETWTEGKVYDSKFNGQLIGPAIYHKCRDSVLSLLKPNKDFQPLSDNLLGSAFVAQLDKNYPFNNNTNWIVAQFYLWNNYLLEYSLKKETVSSEPKGYAHLQYAIIKPCADCANALEIELYRDNCFEEVDTSNARKKVLQMLLQSEEERDSWVRALTHASNLDISDLYVFDKNMVIGKGRYASVFCAKRKTVNENRATNAVKVGCDSDYNCALKIIPKKAFWDRVLRGRERMETLVNEAAIHLALSAYAYQETLFSEHDAPPFVQLQNFFETRDDLVLELELICNNDLFRYLLTHEVLDEKEAAFIIRDTLKCIQMMESLHIAHRDIKPANMLMCDKTVYGVSVKVGDFGMSNMAREVDGLIRGRCGTPGYVAPEIFKAGVNEGYQNKVDIFSTGVTMYLILCGYEPFFGETDAELVEANKKGEYEFLDEDWCHVSDEAIDLIQKMMETNPSQRITAAEALRHPWITCWTREG